jgi:hypothetical protein
MKMNMIGSKSRHFRTIVLLRSRNQIIRNAAFSSSSANSDDAGTFVAEVDISKLVDKSSSNHQAALADSIRPYFEQQTPVILRGASSSSEAPALHRWQNLTTTWPDYLPPHQMGGVEIGGSYSSDSTDRAEIPMLDYLQYLRLFEERHGAEGAADPWELPSTISSEELVYMAQNDLPEPLYKDVEIPGFCQDEKEESSYRVGHGRLYSVMMWLGPRACVSPLHFDPLDNILMQFVGRKAVWLYDPKQNGGMWHYAGHDGQQSNTSPVNPEKVDEAKYPLFVQEKSRPAPLRCVLNPGDMLYIPSKWWHFVRSVDTSASVNVWWR